MKMRWCGCAVARSFLGHPMLTAEWMDAEQCYEQRIAAAPHACPRFRRDCNNMTALSELQKLML